MLFGLAPEWWQWVISGTMFVAGVTLVATGVGGVAGGMLICAGANSIIGSYTNEAAGGSSLAGWVGGMVTGAVCGLGAGIAGNLFCAATNAVNLTCIGNLFFSGTVGFGLGSIGSFSGQYITSIIDGTEFDVEKALLVSAYTGGVNCLSGIASGIGNGLKCLPEVSSTSTTLASFATAAWSVVSEAVADFFGLLTNLF